MKLNRNQLRRTACARTFLITVLLLKTISSAQQPINTAVKVEEMMPNMKETYPVSQTWNTEQTPTSSLSFDRDQALSITPSFKAVGFTLNMTSEPHSREDNTSIEMLQMESLLPVTQSAIVKEEWPHAGKNITNVNLKESGLLLINTLAILPALEKANNPEGTMLKQVTNSDLKPKLIKNSSSEDESRTKKKKMPPSIVKSKTRNLKRKEKLLTKKRKTGTKGSSGSRNETEKKAEKNIKKTYKQNNVSKKSKHRKKKKEPKPTEYMPYFEDHYCPPACACYGRVVQCSDKGLAKIPYGAPFNTRYLLLMNNKIDFIQLDLLSEYFSLEFLVLNKNKLTDGAIEGAFEDMPKLTRLFIDENKLSSFPADLPASLQELRINDNNISHISDRAMARCSSLKILSLERNTLTDKSIPSGTFKSINNLQIIRLNFNQLETVPSNLTASLKELFLEDNKITVIPCDVFSEPAELANMFLNNNHISNKGIKKKAFKNMTKLEHLNMANNLLKAVPKHLPKSLRKLILSDNSISSVKKDVFLKLLNLTQVILSGNKIIRIESGSFKGLSGLEHLDISYNQLREVPRRLPVTLRTLFLFNNQIRHIPGDSFCGNKHVESHLVLVRLENNKISHSNIDAHALRCLRGYQVVHF